ncbi:MAG: hypothetical protein H7336_15540 [Bacteriovorax sp.]|nr:hypothetical protein [Bacteriovorax sp.]
MSHNYKIEGIYDQRTLKLLKAEGLKDFGFNFSPKSFNFIQEHVFLTELVPLLGVSDNLHLHFTRSNDPMIKKVIDDLKKEGVGRERIYINCDEWSESPESHGIKYYLNYYPEVNLTWCNSKLFSGMIFEFSFFEDLHQRGILNNFITNFYTHFNNLLSNEKKIILRIDWNNNIFPSLFDYFDFDLMSFPINSKIEICYRNVDLKKLSAEMALIEKSRNSADRF